MEKKKGLKRIDTKYTGFSSEFIRLPILYKQRMVIHAIRLAVSRSRLPEEVVREGLQHLESLKKSSFPGLEELEVLRDCYDNKYFDYQETNSKISNDFFMKARAVSSLIFGIEAKTDDEMLESIYEASFVEEDNIKFKKEIESVIKDNAIPG